MLPRIFLSSCILSALCLPLWRVEAQDQRQPGAAPRGDVPVPVVPPQNAVQGGSQGATVAPGAMDDSDIINLAEHPACAADVRRLCAGMPNKKDPEAAREARNSLDVLECFLNHEDRAVSAPCHQIMYQFKVNITRDPRIAGIADTQCQEDLGKGLAACSKYRQDSGHFISCVVEHKDAVTVDACLTFLNKVAVVIFSDYHLVADFVQACDADIQRLQCGFLDNQRNAQAPHSQGATIQCLLHNMQLEQKQALEAKAKQQDGQSAGQMAAPLGQLAPECGHHLMRLMELQADDYHLDRALFMACRDDRERFCPKVQAGQGRVYQCLLQNVQDATMHPDCKTRLEEREVAAQTDYKVDYAMAQSCKTEIERYKCAAPDTHTHEYGLSFVILCLEGPLHKEEKHSIGPQCQEAMQFHRQALMSDHNLSPNILVFCQTDIQRHCSSKNIQPQAYIHCLMGAAQPTLQHGQNGQEGSYVGKLSPVCMRELEQLLMMADPASDIKVDVVLYQACGNIIHNRCGGNMHAPALRMMGCLMENMHAQDMTEQCEKHLLESHYFMTRDIRLDAELFAACRKEAVSMCSLKDDWSPESKNQQTPAAGPVVFGCLYRHAVTLGPDKTGLSAPCKAQVIATLHQRAVARDLPPGVDIVCIHDLAYFCSDKPVRKGQEMNCLQENYGKLQTECKSAVETYSQAINKDAKLSETYYNCASMLETFCKSSLDEGSTFDDAMTCLIPHKEEEGMDKKCYAEIEHYQMVNIQEFNLNFRFKESCKVDKDNFCPGVKDLGEIVLCLSSINREDIVGGAKPRLRDACRKQLRSELLIRAERVDLDPYIQQACHDDIPKVCPPGVAQGDILECLRSKDKKELSKECAQRVFKIEMVQAVDAEADFALLKACKRMIKKFCPDAENSKILSCLVENKKQPEMDERCRKMVVTRQMEEGKDLRLNAGLFKGCQEDLTKFCRNDLTELSKQTVEAPQLEAALVDCLRKHRKELTPSCNKEITTMFKEVALDYRLDKNLQEQCSDEINSCHKSDEMEKGEVVECLKQKLKEGKMRVPCARLVSHLVAEGKADLHVDPQLFAACQPDLLRHCGGVDPGEGRQFQCLSGVRASGQKLNSQCDSKLKERMDLVKYATKYVPMENVEQIMEAVVDSPAKYYFLAVMGGALSAVLCVGICCGRATKRVRRELKNR